MATLFALLWSLASAHPPLAAQSYGRAREINLESRDVSFTQRHYYVNVAIGIPPQNVSLLLDTTSAYVRVDDIECKDCLSESRFTRKDSHTFHFERNVNFGRAPAVIGQDNIEFGNLRVMNQTLAVLKQNSSKDYRGFDGLLVCATQGLGFEHPDMGDLNLLENLKRNRVIDRAVFALYLSTSSWDAEGSVITFDSYNLSRYSWNSSFEFAPVDLTNGTWAFNLTDAFIGGTRIHRKPRTAILGTAIGRMVFPKDAYNATWNYICRVVPCMYWDEPYWNCTRHPRYLLGDLAFTLGSIDFSISPYEYTYSSGGDYCYFNFRTMAGKDTWILGTQFMQNYYILFDAEQSRVGFAHAKHELSATAEFWIWVFIICVLLGIAGCVAAFFIVKKIKQA